ncbi:LolA-like protein [Altibacter lentus]|uniref:outer membrane lipoprotein-sorting protein n=1 Tax=Altibacter lentus TaxID=1223410 RepID=UPI00054E557F|nr:outer membrane lipoprotein-sorting protein [Altibacter lentus]
MKTLQLFILAFLFVAIAPLSAQSADEIIANYLENTGGAENWEKLSGIEFTGKINVQGMQLPIIQVQTKSGKQMMKADVQGQTFYQEVYDGETLWGTNQMTMAAEKSDAETTNNFKNNLNDFPDPFLNYKDKNYTVELIGNETIEGTETYKIKLVKEPIMVDGNEVEDVSYYYFDTENFVPIVVEEEITQGPGKGMMAQVKFSDYQEVDGLYFPFAIVQGVKDQPGMQITLTEIKLNPDIDDTMFSYPEEK